MNAADLARLKALVAGGWPNTEFTDAQFDVWAEYLAPHPFDTVAGVVRRAIATETWRPTVATIVAALYAGPSAPEVASQAWAAIGRYGYHSEDRARAELAPVVWDAIETFGGWMAWCCSPDAPETRERMARIATRVVRTASTRPPAAAVGAGGPLLQLPVVGHRLDALEASR